MRLHIYILLGFFLTTFIIGSFLDLQLSEAIFSKGNAFGLVVSILGTLAGYSCLALCGGILFGLAFTREYKTIAKVLLYIGAVVAFGLGIYYAGREFFGANGFPNEDIVWAGYLIALPFMCGASFLGYIIAKRSDDKFLLNVVIVLMIAIFMSLVPGVTLLKSVFHRPRYRTLSDPLYPEITFHNWWQRCTNYSDLMKLYHFTDSEEFKSFPSGHAGASLILALTAVFAPKLYKNTSKCHLILFYGGFAFALLVCFSRILVGAHFLSDVSMGALLTTIFALIANEVVIYFENRLNKKNQQ